MRLLFEEYNYDTNVLLKGLGFENDFEAFTECFKDLIKSATEKSVRFGCVGYYHCADKHVQDSVYIMPRVFVNKIKVQTADGETLQDRVFAKQVNSTGESSEGYDPKEIIRIEFKKKQSKEETASVKLAHNEYLFITDLVEWIYGAIKRYSEQFGKGNIIDGNLQRIVTTPGETTETMHDTIECMIKFYKEHRNLFTFVAINRNSGASKVNWKKTISSQVPYLQGNQPIYMSLVSKGKSINYEEDVIVMFLSVMNYLRNRYYHGGVETGGYQILPTSKIEQYILSGKGVRVMKQMKHKYFTDDLVYLCDMLRLFFEQAYDVMGKPQKSEITIVKKFDRVFEHMIDCLIGDQLPIALKYMKNQYDGKNIDHIYHEQSLFPEVSSEIYYIGDSKYYKEGSDIGTRPIAKQYTYAKNVIQYCIDIFNDEGIEKRNYSASEDDGTDSAQKEKRKNYVKKEEENIKNQFLYRDDLTEGYNITPNFFIQGRVLPEHREVSKTFYDYDLIPDKENANFEKSYQFRNRLFDRDTLILQTYDLNFLFLLANYVSRGEKESVRQKIRNSLKTNLTDVINKKYNFYTMTCKPGCVLKEEVDKWFKKLNGKIFRLSEDDGQIILALEKSQECRIESLNLLWELKQTSKFQGYEKFMLGALPLLSREIHLFPSLYLNDSFVQMAADVAGVYSKISSFEKSLYPQDLYDFLDETKQHEYDQWDYALNPQSLFYK